jgi:hypothetical protein
VSDTIDFNTTEERRIGLTQVGDISISTVFLGLDHNHSGSGNPVLFETMTFSGEEQVRYETYAEAVMGHIAMVQEVKGRLGIVDPVPDPPKRTKIKRSPRNVRFR